jgi:hypothetical protein
MHTCIILALPQAVIKEIFVKWLWLRQIVRLDSAFCDKGTRAHFLEAAYGPEVIYPVEHDILYNLVVPWYLLRGVQVDGVWFGEDLVYDEALRRKYFARFGKGFRWMKYHGHLFSRGFQAATKSKAVSITSTTNQIRHISLRMWYSGALT